MCLLERVKRLIRIFACRVEDYLDHHLAGLDHGFVSVLQHLDLLHGPFAELPVQLCFGLALEALLLFLVHRQLPDCPSNQGNSVYSRNQRFNGRVRHSTHLPVTVVLQAVAQVAVSRSVTRIDPPWWRDCQGSE